jgi:hypothetical protein
MAFNPFHSFRKHQKVIFAVMAIVCMFVFVLQFGKGDVFERIATMFGGSSKSQGAYVATLYGSKVYEKELVDQGHRQQAASALVGTLINAAVNSAVSDAAALKLDKDREADLKRVLTNMQGRRDSRGQTDPAADLLTVRRLKEAAEKSGNEQEKKVLDELEGALQVQSKIGYFIMVMYQGQYPYFGPRQPQDMLDFRLWQHQADALGIVLNDDDVRKLLARETGGRDMLPQGSFKSDPTFKKEAGGFLTAYSNYTEGDILEALRQEYRVLLAQEALLGEPEGRYLGRDLHRADGKVGDSYSPASVSPGDFLSYLRDQRAAVKVALLPIPVAAFEDRVKDEPAESQLRDLYEKHKDDEPAPDRTQPGFKQPRRVRVEYVTGSPDSEYYQQAGKRQVAMSAAAQVLGGAQPYGAGGGVGALAASAARPVTQDPALKAQDEYLRNVRKYIVLGAWAGPEQTDRSYAAASDLGSVLAGLSAGNPWVAPGGVLANESARQANEARGAAATFMGAAGSNPLGQPALALPFVTSPPPPSKVEPSLLRQAEQTEARALLMRNLKTVEQELKKLAAKPEEAKAYIEKATKEYGLEHKTMTVARDEYALIDDPALAIFKKGQDDKPDEPVTVAKRVGFARLFLNSTGTYKPVYWSSDAGDSESERAQLNRQFAEFARSPELAKMVEQQTERQMEGWLAFWAQSRQPVLFWRAQDDQAHARSFKAVSDEVLQAWKHRQARLLARKAARELEAESKQRKWPTDAATREQEVKAWLDGQKLGQAFVLDNVARQLLEPRPAGADKDKDKKSYRPYTVPEKDVPYAPAKFLDALLRLQEPGDATYIADQPENTLYLAVLLVRTPPSDKEFEDAVAHPANDPLWEECVRKQREDFRKAYLGKMREEAAPKEVEDGEWIDAVHKHWRKERE